jgi:hypothetical protein
MSCHLLHFGRVLLQVTSCSMPTLLKGFRYQQKLIYGESNTHSCSRPMAYKILVSDAQWELPKRGVFCGVQEGRESKYNVWFSCSVRR